MQWIAGIHRKRRLPRFHRPTFSTWFRRRVKPATASAVRPAAAATAGAVTPARSVARKVALFATCTVGYNAPAIGRAAVAVLERNGVDVTLPEQRCCGMPYLDGGAIDQCRALVRDNVRTLAAAVREGREIVTPGPTCNYMLKQE
jgi:glycerol-3-phosphate dehydrogenase subunit C